MQKFSIVFGDNGTGKTTICDVLKSVSGKQDFPSNSPKMVEIETSDTGGNQICKYENNIWTCQIDEKELLFFDIDFVNANVHTHGFRSSDRRLGAHTQKSGKLIVDLDKNANELKQKIAKNQEELTILKEFHSDVLEKQYTKKDQELFETYKDIDKGTRQETLTDIQEESGKLKAEIEALKKLNKKHSEISDLSSLKEIAFLNPLSTKTTYTELFTRQIKEKAQEESDAKIKAHFEKHRQFIEHSMEQIPVDYKDENCPLCMQPLANASGVIEYYRNVFDQEYEKEKEKLLKDVGYIKNELETLKSRLDSLPREVTSVFDKLEEIKANFEIQGIYKLEEKTTLTRTFSDVSMKAIEELLVALESLKTIDRKQIVVVETYDEIVSLYREKEKAVTSVNDLITEKNKEVKSFKEKYSDRSKITEEIRQKTLKHTELTDKFDFLESEKIDLIKKQKEVEKEIRCKSSELKTAEKELETYLSNTIPQNIITQMVDIIEKFDLTFKLEHIKSSTRTKDYAFSFKVKDHKGNERELEDGLSEGERHIISLAFFFAINENAP